MHLKIKLNEKEALKDKLRIEEIRGVFILGLLAILVSIRFKYEDFPVNIGQFSFNLIGLVDITIGFWILYAYFMILGVSEDILGKKFSEQFLNLSRFFLFLYFVFLGIILSIIVLNILASYPLLTLVLILVIIACNKREKLIFVIKKMKAHAKKAK
jgi:predicted Kef-type K+ transport protein